MVAIARDKERCSLILPQWRWVLLIGLFVGGFAGLSLDVDADDAVGPQTPQIAEPETEPKTPTKPDEKERRIKLTAGLAALAGIAIVGIVLAAIIIIWAGRLRRIVREPTSSTGRQDPFWFLRPEKIVLPQDTDEIDTSRSEPS